LRKGDATRARIIDAAARQAAVRGLAAVSLNDVAEAVGLSKSGLFKHFESKDDMHLAVVEAILDRFRDFVRKPAEALSPGRPRLGAIFDNWLAWSDSEWAESGCPVNQLSIEFDDQPGPVRDLLQARMRLFRDVLTAEFRALRDPPMPLEEAQAAYFQMKSFILGHLDSRRLMGDADAARSARSAFHALLDRLQPVTA
jgi:AcrR family transcriptional regulator